MDEETLDETALESVSGGMRWQDFRRSSNVETARGTNNRPSISPAGGRGSGAASNSGLARDLGINSIGKRR